MTQPTELIDRIEVGAKMVYFYDAACVAGYHTIAVRLSSIDHIAVSLARPIVTIGCGQRSWILQATTWDVAGDIYSEITDAIDAS